MDVSLGKKYKKVWVNKYTSMWYGNCSISIFGTSLKVVLFGSYPSFIVHFFQLFLCQFIFFTYDVILYVWSTGPKVPSFSKDYFDQKYPWYVIYFSSWTRSSLLFLVGIKKRELFREFHTYFLTAPQWQIRLQTISK